MRQKRNESDDEMRSARFLFRRDAVDDFVLMNMRLMGEVVFNDEGDLGGTLLGAL